MSELALQYLIDEEGKKTAVIVPIEDWADLQQRLQKFEEYQRMEADLKKALHEVDAIKAGTIKEKSLEDFL